ncbi:MAG TPA: hypothetical protein VFS69_01290 [Sphingomicrobium sp.]|nr:hypothetical protein [Sphingomicrobium sp.]
MYVQNPYLQPPQIEGPQSRSWAQGFTFGFCGPEYSTLAQSDVTSEDSGAFNEGVIAGQSAAINGIDLRNSCVDLNAEDAHGAHLLIEVAGSPDSWVLVGGATRLVKIGVAEGAFSGVMLVFEILVSLETWFDDPEAGLNRGVSKLQEQLQSLGFESGLELYIGAGQNLDERGCELKFTGIYRYQDGATSAAQGLGRAQWMVARWRTDQSGGATVVDYAN